MAYSGYLIKVGSYTIPLKYIKFDSYSVTMNSQDLDSYRDENGILHRTALSNKAPKVEFSTIPLMSQADVNTLLGNIRSNYTNANEKKASVQFYIPETDSYVTQDSYMADIEFEPYLATNSKITYKSFRIAFIGYGGAV